MKLFLNYGFLAAWMKMAYVPIKIQYIHVYHLNYNYYKPSKQLTYFQKYFK